MSDTLERMADEAVAVTRGYVSPGLQFGASRCGAATEFRARRLYMDTLRSCKSNLLDTADLTPVMRDRILAFIKVIEASAPTLTQWDEAMAEKAGKQ
jgi:hypothetical protein